MEYINQLSTQLMTGEETIDEVDDEPDFDERL